MSATAEANKVRVMLWRMLSGAVVGAIGTGLFIVFVGEPHMNMKDPAVLLAAVSGVSYVLIGLMVALGVVSPKTGARFLNVENADELREERSKLGTSAIACVLIGVFVLVLAASGDLVENGAALAIAAACLAGVIVVGTVTAKRYDELTKQLALEASAWGFYATLVLLGGWAALAQLGFVGWVSPLAFVALLILVQLLATFIAIARRGMMMPR